ncbi:MobF family relaxase [Flexivirga alba]|uniref:MobF family relaxase n=1 Tax=Flexivirga alba TaxID=702742 RepID=A0ABW2AJC1_9MICO
MLAGVPRRGRPLAVTMSIRRMTLGAGYRYLMSSVARLDQVGPARGLTAYYAAEGTPPGRFLGAGLAGLNNGRGVASGSIVTEEALWRMLGMLQDPVTRDPLGRRPPSSDTVYVDKAGQVRKARRPVAGFDLTFSAPKSVSVAWALADDATRDRIYAAHHRALEAVIGYAERRVFATRVGKGGVIQDDVLGVVAAAFDHWDSRAHDPQLHTHVVVLNRVQAACDGLWRTVDSRALHRAAVGLSELYNGILADEITAELGWEWTPEQRRHSPEPKWEIAGIPPDLRDHFSQRSSVIEFAKDALAAQFTQSHGRPPVGREIIQLRQQATLATRDKKDVQPLSELMRVWRDRARAFVGGTPQEWLNGLNTARGSNKPDSCRTTPPRLLTADEIGDESLEATAASALARVSDKRATFNRANLLAQALRELHGIRFAAPADRITAAEKAATFATQQAVMLTPQDPEPVPAELRRQDGTSRLRPRDSELFSTREILDAETRLLAAADATDAPTAPPPDFAADGNAAGLSPEQTAAVAAVTTSGRRLDLIVGPAGTGKTRTMAAVRAVWETGYGGGSVVGLAPSAAAAQVLADAVGVPAENTAKWISEQARYPHRAKRLEQLSTRLSRAYPSPETRRVQAEYVSARAEFERWRLGPGTLVIVDEASMASTRDLDRITAAAHDAGAKVLLVGDWAQLSPVQAGGAFKLLADTHPEAPTLHDVRRFQHEWERDASLRLRAGDVTVAKTYLAHGRVKFGQREDLLDLLFDAWRTDTRAGLASLMLAADAETVTDLNTRAHAYRVACGEIGLTGVHLGDGTTAGVGDTVITRLNQRALVTGRGWVKNGDDWIVQAINEDGSIRLARPGGGAIALLPPEYATNHLELGYATTAHRAQGRTVDTAHAFLNAATMREPLYVMASRGRESNRLYIDTAVDLAAARDHGGEQGLTEPESVLRVVIAASGADASASEVRGAEHRGTWRPSPDRARACFPRDVRATRL